YIPRVEPAQAAEARISVDMRQAVETKPRVEAPPPVDVKPKIDSRSAASPRPGIAPPPPEPKRVETMPPVRRRSDELRAKEMPAPAPAAVAEVADNMILDRLAELEKPGQAPVSTHAAAAKQAPAPVAKQAAVATVESTPAPMSGSFLGVSFDEAAKAPKSSGKRAFVYVAVAVVVIGGGAAAAKFGLKKKGQANPQLAQVSQNSMATPPVALPSSSPDPLVVDVGSPADASTQAAADPSANGRDQSQEDLKQQRLRDEQERQRLLQQQQQQAQQNRAAQPSPTGSAPPPTPQPTRHNAAVPPTVQSINVNSTAPAFGTPGSSGLSSSTPAQPAPLPQAPAQTPQPRRSTGPIQGQVIRRVEPVYPPAAKTANVSGSVVVEVSIDEKGNVVGARAVSGSGMLAPAAVAAARGFRFTPTTLDGVPVRSSRAIVFNFRM
ncbi:MAG: TonB family protein, partial [Blastocatellia bacterium]